MIGSWVGNPLKPGPLRGWSGCPPRTLRCLAERGPGRKCLLKEFRQKKKNEKPAPQGAQWRSLELPTGPTAKNQAPSTLGSHRLRAAGSVCTWDKQAHMSLAVRCAEVVVLSDNEACGKLACADNATALTSQLRRLPPGGRSFSTDKRASFAGREGN